MIIFYGKGMVWDKQKNKLLCKFENGEYKTEDKHEQSVLKNLEYEHEEIKKVVPDLSNATEEDLKKVNKDDIKAYLDQGNVQYDSKATKEDLVALIVGDDNDQE